MTDVANRAGVAVQGDTIVILFPRSALSKDDALNLAAWLVALASDDGEYSDSAFAKMIAAIRNT